MSDPFIGEIRFFPYTFAPSGWLLCDGSLVPVMQYQALFAVLSIMYGGDGRTNFGLPNITAPVGTDPTGVHLLNVASVGKSVGASTVQLNETQLPPHYHQMTRHKPQSGYDNQTSAPSATSDLGGLASSSSTSYPIFAQVATPNVQLHVSTIGAYGQGGAHANNQPYQVLRACIAYEGIYPVQD